MSFRHFSARVRRAPRVIAAETVRRTDIASASIRERRSQRALARAWQPIGPGPVDPRVRRDLPFVRDEVLSRCSVTRTIEGRRYQYVLLPGESPTLCVHFSAFFGEWGSQAAYRRDFFGFFHRLRMFWPDAEHTYLFVCDTFGADANGTYYKGEGMDFFVERAMNEILAEHEAAAPAVVGLGSSMGATAALRFAIQRGWRGAVGVVPHLDLDTCAERQGRWRHVAAVLGAEDVLAERHFPVTREIRNLAESAPSFPRIAIQTCRDDVGVHYEQVVPFVETLRRRGCSVLLDERPTGGHTSEYATSDWFDSAIEWCLEEPLEANG